MTKQVKLGELESGMIFKKGDTYGIKSEYRNTKGICESYIIGSGEMFWGGTGNPNALKVEPIDFDWLLQQAETLRRIADAWVAIETNGTMEDANNFYTIVQDILTPNQD